MSRGVELPGPDALPPGPVRQLTEALHEIYDAAGRPPLRAIERDVAEGEFRDAVSYQTVRELLRGSAEQPSWTKLECVVRVLARGSSPRRDEDAETTRFKRLWDAVVVQPAQVRVGPRGTRVRSVFVLGGVTGQTRHKTYERTVLERFCNQLGAAIGAAGVDLIVCSPFTESSDVHVLLGYVESQTSGNVHMHRPSQMHRPGSPTLEQQMRELRDLVGAAAMDRMQQWYYPEPETNDPEAIGQAWLLCQLMAVEHADVVVAIGGRPNRTANTILRLAEARRQLIVPYTFLGGAAQLAYQRRPDWQEMYPWLDVNLLADKNAAAAVIDIANQMIVGSFRETGPRALPSRVFISRARGDAGAARLLEYHLTNAGLTVLLGERELRADKVVESAIGDSVLRSDLFIALWSRGYAASPYCFDELDLAVQRYQAGQCRLWIINLDGSDIVPPAARRLPQVQARTAQEVADVVRDLLDNIPPT